ncbi:hypothetical protein NDU88_005197 [Pleurodeles waltl]|uniref:Uncharacterized protein n=1 Tax=Pleurodeles waltl TaxID=8319 RepID=A0AAV7VLZ3_PLEWA|nr:hypothetical protein NDU88_005197 [Pleurodeles waltl]
MGEGDLRRRGGACRVQQQAGVAAGEREERRVRRWPGGTGLAAWNIQASRKGRADERGWPGRLERDGAVAGHAVKEPQSEP